MKKVFMVFVVFSLLQSISSEQHQCSRWINKTIPITKCCKLISMFPSDLLKQANEDLAKEDKTQKSYSCKIWQKIFEKSNMTSLNQSEISSTFEKTITDQEWWTAFNNSINLCIDFALKNVDTYQISINVSREECDGAYALFIDCMVFVLSIHCPEKNYMNSDQCVDVRKFFHLCGDNKGVVDEYVKFHYVKSVVN